MARQIDFAVHHLNRYLSEKGAEAVGVRRLHYNIVSQPEADRMIPTKGGGVRLYENTLADYNRLVELIGRVFSDLCVSCGVVAVDE